MARRTLLRVLDGIHRIETRQQHILRRLGPIEQALQISIINDALNQEATMTALDNLETDVANQTDVIDSAVRLLETLHQELADAIASGDPARVQAVADQLEANTQNLAQAVAANTPADNGGTDEIPGGNVPDDGTGEPVDQPVDDSGAPTDQP